MNLIEVGKTTVILGYESWEKHGRTRNETRILCVNNPFSDYDGLRDGEQSFKDVKEAVDWIVENEGQIEMADYTTKQIENLKNKINEKNDQIYIKLSYKIN